MHLKQKVVATIPGEIHPASSFALAVSAQGVPPVPPEVIQKLVLIVGIVSVQVASLNSQIVTGQPLVSPVLVKMSVQVLV